MDLLEIRRLLKESKIGYIWVYTYSQVPLCIFEERIEGIFIAKSFPCSKRTFEIKGSDIKGLKENNAG